MTDLIIALSAAAVALTAVAALVALLRRRPAANAPLAAAVEAMNARLEGLSRDLADALQRAEEEGRRGRLLGELTGTIDLDEVVARTLAAAGALPGVEAALLHVVAADGSPVVAAHGLSLDAAAKQLPTGPPDGRPARAVAIGFLYRDVPGDNGLPLRAGLAVPLWSGEQHLGWLAVYARGADAFGDAELCDVEALAERAGPALDNARRFREARHLADMDALTGLHNRRYFHETLAREVARAHRYQRSLSLIIFDLDDFKAVNDRIGHLAGDGVLAEAAERVLEVVRSADVACRVGGDEFAVILPESGLDEAENLHRRIQGAVAARALGEAGRLGLSAGIAELRPEDDALSFFERADDALYRAKAAGKGRAVSESGGTPSTASLPRTAPGTAGSS